MDGKQKSSGATEIRRLVRTLFDHLQQEHQHHVDRHTLCRALKCVLNDRFANVRRKTETELISRRIVECIYIG